VKRRGPRRASLELRPEELGLPSTGEPRLFLGRLTGEALGAELQAAGIPAFLAARGFPDVRVGTDLAEGEHRLRVAASDDGALLVELRLAEMATPVPAALRAERSRDPARPGDPLGRAAEPARALHARTTAPARAGPPGPRASAAGCTRCCAAGRAPSARTRS
jgi:hypothetical protein